MKFTFIKKILYIQKGHFLKESHYVFVSKWGVDKNGRCFKVIQSKDFNRNVPIVIKGEIVNLDDGKVLIERFLANKFYDLYDTSEVIRVQHYEEQKTKKKNKKKQKATDEESD